MKILALVLLIGIANASAAAQIDIVTNPGPKWELEEGARAKFNAFLEGERVRLVQQLPGLELPAAFASMDAAVPVYFSADTPKFRNRQAACSFLEKVRKHLKAGEAQELDVLTQNKKVCIQADLDPAKQLEWTVSMGRFLWNAKWIPLSGRIVNLQVYLEHRLPAPKPFVGLQITAINKSPFDAWGIAQSQQDLDFFAGVPNIRKALAAVAKFDPNDSATFGALGPDFQKFVEKDPFNAANLLRSQPTVYLSNGWPPNGIVEVLAHEYGHIYRRLSSTHYSGDNKKLIWLNDEVHEEGAAEACAWIGLSPLYHDYPEIEVYHIAKLIMMNKSQNFHYLGAAALQDLFHSPKANFEKLKALDAAHDLEEFLKVNKIRTLVMKGQLPQTVIPATFSP